MHICTILYRAVRVDLPLFLPILLKIVAASDALGVGCDSGFSS
jgi:hypothetical protein